jgi:hypothetical protein
MRKIRPTALVKSSVSRVASSSGTPFVVRTAARTAIVLALLCLLSADVAQSAADVVLIGSAKESSSWKQQTELACRFYGLEAATLDVANEENGKAALSALGDSSILAAIMSADILSHFDRTSVLAALRRPGGYIPLLIVGVKSGTDPAVLKAWTDNRVLAGEGPAEISAAGTLEIANQRPLARELSGQSLSNPGGLVSWLSLNQASEPQLIISIKDGDRDLPVLVSSGTEKQSIFFQAEYQLSTPPTKLRRSGVLPAVVPFLMFLRYAAGDRAWHSIRHYANLTIDDAWLTEPYGNLNYEALLGEMQKHNFHTTIAFIPWNFDRSKADVVSIIRSNPDRYSISVHGNNHDHVEFDDYAKRSLTTQQFDLQQALARMERFRALTGLSYDEVMVWPHEVVPPVPTLALMKQYNFLGNVNADVVPQGSVRPDDPLFLLRSQPLRFGNFPTVERTPVSARVSSDWLQTTVASDAFLDSPILFYAHHDLFVNGIGAFDRIADLVNRTQPGTSWASLGEVMRHLYLVRRRRDGDFDVKAFSSQVTLENQETQDLTFFVEKEESFAPPIQSITSGSESISYLRTDKGLSFHVTVPGGQSRTVVVAYSNELNLASVDVSKSSPRVALLRRISDFRDLWVTRSTAGVAFLGFYNRHLSSTERGAERALGSPALWSVLVLMVLFAVWRILQRTSKGRKAAEVPEGRLPPT